MMLAVIFPIIVCLLVVVFLRPLIHVVLIFPIITIINPILTLHPAIDDFLSGSGVRIHVRILYVAMEV